MMKKSLISIACAAAMSAPAAQAELTANIGVTTDYLWRGMTQTGHEAAVQGGIDYSHESGFYIGTWASSLGGGSHEVDGYFGLSGEIGQVGYDIGYIYYYYTNAGTPGADFSEIYGSLSYGWLTGGVNYTVSGDAPAGSPFTDGDIYLFATAEFDLEPIGPDFKGWGVAVTVGHYDFDAGSVFDYTHAQLDVTKSAGDFGDFTLSVAHEDLFEDTSVALTWTKTF